jgi:hypothetical protein
MDPLTTTTVDSESHLSYPGWKIVLAGFFGVMVSFRGCCAIYVWPLPQAALAHIQLAARSDLRRLQHCCSDRGRGFSRARLSAGPVRPTPRHPSMHCYFLSHVCVPGSAHAAPDSLLPRLLSHRSCRQRNSVSRLLSRHLDLVQSPPRPCSLDNARWWWLRSHAPPGHCTSRHYPLRLAYCLRRPRGPCSRPRVPADRMVRP